MEDNQITFTVEVLDSRGQMMSISNPDPYWNKYRPYTTILKHLLYSEVIQEDIWFSDEGPLEDRIIKAKVADHIDRRKDA